MFGAKNPVRPGSYEPGDDPFPNDGAFKLGKDTAHLEHGPPRGLDGVKPLMLKVQVNSEGTTRLNLPRFSSIQIARKPLQNRVILCYNYL